jgi:hypothetical protein
MLLGVAIGLLLHSRGASQYNKKMALCDLQCSLASWAWLLLYGIRFVQDHVGGALSFAAVPRVGLWPTTPP